MKRGERVTVWILVVALLILLVFALWVSGAGAEELPQPPDGCQIASYIEWPPTDSIGGWGGWDRLPPYDDLCGFAIKVDGEWYSNIQWGCSDQTSDGKTTCRSYPAEDIVLTNKTIVSESGITIRGFQGIAPRLEAGVLWVAQTTQAEQVYRAYAPQVWYNVRPWGWLLPPWPGE